MFYIATDGKLMSAEVDGRGSEFKVGAVHALLSLRLRDQFNGTLISSLAANGPTRSGCLNLGFCCVQAL